MQHALDVEPGRVAQPQLHGLVAARHVLLRFFGQRFFRLVAQRNAAGVCGNAPPAASQQFVQRHVGGLAADVPQRQVDARERERGAGAQPVARQLHAVHALPGADVVGRLHADQHGRDGVVDQAHDGAGTAPRMGLAVAGDAFGGFDTHDDGVALDGAAHAHGHRLALGQTERQGNGGDPGDLHGAMLSVGR